MYENNELSERELEILKLVATGASNKEIASQLVISPNTVKVHLRNIFTKIDVVSRTEATLYAIRIGLIKPESAGHEDIADNLEGNVPIGLLAETKSPPRWRRVLIVVSIVVTGILLYFALKPILFPETQPGTVVTVPETRWINYTDMPDARSAMAGAAYEGIVYLIGGQKNGVVSDEVMAYDAINDRWEKKSSKPTPVTAASAAVIGEKFYMPGGLIDKNTATDMLEIYDPRTDRWEKGPSMPKAMGAYALASYEGKLYLFGGWNGINYSSIVYTYDPVMEIWEVNTEMKAPRAYSTAAVLGSKIFVVGGENDQGALDDTQVYYPDRLDQGETAWEKRAAIPEERSGASMAALAGGLYLAGGMDGKGDSSLNLIKYDENKDSWEKLEAPQALLGFQPSLLAVDTRIHIFGGEINQQSQALHTAYQAIYTVLIPAITR